MRVLSGKAKGKPLLAVPGDTTRPILDRVKQSLFDMLRPDILDSTWLDVFGGTGAVGIEALSQGASHCIFVDVEKKAVEIIKKNLANTGLQPQANVRHQDALTYLRNTKNTFDFIYVAPPQYKGIWIRTMQDIAERPFLLKSSGTVIVQIDPKENDETEFLTLHRASERRHGNTLFIFFEKKEES